MVSTSLKITRAPTGTSKDRSPIFCHELGVFDPHGRSRFQLLQNSLDKEAQFDRRARANSISRAAALQPRVHRMAPLPALFLIAPLPGLARRSYPMQAPLREGINATSYARGAAGISARWL
jgi:hypothetical protein